MLKPSSSQGINLYTAHQSEVIKHINTVLSLYNKLELAPARDAFRSETLAVLDLHNTAIFFL